MPTINSLRNILYASEPKDGLSCAASLIRATGNRNRQFSLGTVALEVEPAITHLDRIAAQQPHPIDAANDAGEDFVLCHAEDDGGGAADEVEEAGV
jgi:hypothetical protein